MFHLVSTNLKLKITMSIYMLKNLYPKDFLRIMLLYLIMQRMNLRSDAKKKQDLSKVNGELSAAVSSLSSPTEKQIISFHPATKKFSKLRFSIV